MSPARPPLSRARAARERVLRSASSVLERLTLPADKALMRRNRHLVHVPGIGGRRGGKVSYGEWCWLIGLLQTMLFDLVDPETSPKIVDVGCGTGLAMIAAAPLAGDQGEILGLDVRREDIEFCRRHYPDPPFRFEVLDQHNARYAPNAAGHDTEAIRWPIEDGSADLVTAISLWTHLARADAEASMTELGRVLRPGAAALISVFLVDPGRGTRPTGSASRFHRTDPSTWQFDRDLGHGWFCPSWADPPEQAIGLTEPALGRMAAANSLDVERIVPGTWPERPGLYFQDLVVLRRR